MNKIAENVHNFSSRLREARQAACLTQAELAKKLGLKGNTPVYRFESGVSSPSIETLCCIAEVLKIDLHWLITGKPSLAVERLRIYASAHIADVYQKIEGLKKLRAEYELQQAVGQDRTKEIEKTDSEIMSLIKYGGDLRRHLNEVLEPIGRAFE
jgi:transcriptional regulator with XRE-family HTH domain